MSEISGVVKNALDRGWETDEIRSSLVNAGYPLAEVNLEIDQVKEQTKIVMEKETKKVFPLDKYQIPDVTDSKKKQVILSVAVVTISIILLGIGLSIFLMLK